jgi:hypothetical protein
LAGGLVAALVFFFVIMPKPQHTLVEESLVLSLEDTLTCLHPVFRNDPELESQFNALLLATIREELADDELLILSLPVENPLFWEDLTEEELLYLELEIKKDIKS